MLIMYLWINGQFFRYVGTTAGAWFVPVSVFFHLMLSLVITIGAARGAVQLLFGPERRKAMLYR